MGHKMKFPEHFLFGTSTSAGQIESAIEHDWMGFRASDGAVLSRTTDHELHWKNDVDLVAGLAPGYRMSLMWSRLQKSPLAEFDPVAMAFYRDLLDALVDRKVDIMLVMHHFVNPLWFAEAGGWTNPKSVHWWMDYVRRLVRDFGSYVSSWNTFNEPNLYVNLAYLNGIFPPRKTNPWLTWQALRNMSRAHQEAVAFIHAECPGAAVGISHNAAVMEPDNLFGVLPAKLVDWWYQEFLPDWFRSGDFFGLSYYARIGFDPLPVTWMHRPERLQRSGKQHDDMWEYHPEGLLKVLMRYHKKYRKPLIVTENGICTSNDRFREQAIRDYLKAVHQAIGMGADVRAYYHWSAWDNFEWHLGPSYKFGLADGEAVEGNRARKPSADLYSGVAFSRVLDCIDDQT